MSKASILSAGKLPSIRLSFLIPSLMVFLVLAACTAVGVIGFVNGRDGLQKAAEAELGMVISSRSGLMNARIASVETDIINVASGAGIGDALTNLGAATMNLDSQRAEIFGYYKKLDGAAERAELTGRTTSPCIPGAIQRCMQHSCRSGRMAATAISI